MAYGDETNRLAWRIYETLKEKGCGIGNASVAFIEKELKAAHRTAPQDWPCCPHCRCGCADCAPCGEE